MVAAITTAILAGPVMATEAPTPRPHPDRISGELPPIPRVHPDRATEPIGETVEGDGAAIDTNAPGALETAEAEMFEALMSPDLLLTTAYRRFEAGDFDTATRIARATPDADAALLIDWLIAIEGGNDVTWQRLDEAQSAVSDWPAQRLMQIRFEQALRSGEPDPAIVLEVMEGREPILEPTVLLVARSLIELGRDDEAAELIRSYWREANFSEEMETAILTEFGELLRTSDHSWRMTRLLYDRQSEAALRVSGLLDTDMQAMAAAWSTVNAGGAAAALLNAVPNTLRSDPGYLYAQLRQLVRSGAYREAATLLAGAPTDPSVLIDPEAWSGQRRSIARALMERGDAETAYEVVAGHSAVDRGELVEAEFMAGWIALSFLDEPVLALPHFETLAASSSLPLSQSRAYYWIGRCHDAIGDRSAAIAAYEIAGGHHTTYHGQLALLELGHTTLPLAAESVIDDDARQAFATDAIVKAIGWLISFGRDSEAALLARFLGDTLDDAASVALLTDFLEAEGEHQLALQVAKLAANRGLAVDRSAFPTAIFADESRLTASPDLALMLAVARQESAFNIEAESSAGAIGLLQILPSTARETAIRIGVVYSESRLRTDPDYNATIGAAYLRGLLDRYSGHYGLALAAFNAGLGRVDRWIVEYGDPRTPAVDAIDWIERIPFDETRNYVQRVLENYQVYRSILGSSGISLSADLAL